MKIVVNLHCLKNLTDFNKLCRFTKLSKFNEPVTNRRKEEHELIHKSKICNTYQNLKKQKEDQAH